MSKLDPAAKAEFRLPAEPYPGLRPFLDHESMLLFGRMRQIKEIIEHLRTNQFVAVIGGSGSGKSSLINAGVVPELRSFGIRGAGDFWIPMVSTPGTAAGEVKSDEVTPITRFARKFSRLLTSRGSKADDDARVADIVQCLRQGAGFSLLADTYVNELAVPPGPKARDARLLFVIDQFEELFHPSNKDCEDAGLLVERVLDHFFRPHERCFVVLTMRSEHLSDCASYLELPDAINKASYLVRRLDEDELREAITAPAQRFLRLLQRKASVGTSQPAVTLPEQVLFHDDVLARLLRDVQAITHDPDHLPLLQHLLARMWQTACRREDSGLPASILLADLAHAVAANASGDVALPHDVNVLRASVENWAEAIFARRSSLEQEQIEALFRHLAFKEPNTGMYSQQRVNVDDPALLGEESGPSNRKALLALIEEPDRTPEGHFGFIGSVDYLFWDDEDPQRVTLKVSHESFIRGWMRFRSLIDREAERFEAFVELLRRCGRWSGAGRPDRLLLDSADLERITDERLKTMFADLRKRASWHKLLMLDRDGPRLAPYDNDVDEFVALSDARQRAAVLAREEAAELTRVAIEDRRIAQANAAADKILADAELRQAQRVNNRNILLGLMALGLAIALVPNVLFSLRVQAKVMKSLDHFASARAIAERNMSSDGQPIREENERKLTDMLHASEYVIDGKKHGTFSPDHRLDQALLYFGRMIPMGDAKLLVAKSTSEPVVNGQLRSLLTSTVWRSHNEPAKLAEGAVRLPSRSETNCTVTGARPLGILLLNSETQQGIFMPYRNGDLEFTLYAASYSGNVCSASSIIWSVPHRLNPAMIFDAGLRYMALAADGPSGSDSSVSIYSISWDPVAVGQPPAALLQFGWVVPDSGVAELVRKAASEPATARANEDGAINGAKTWSELGGIGVAVAGISWRIFSPGAETVPSKHPDDWTKLNKPEPGSQCERLGSALQGRYQKARNEIYQANKHCFEIIQGNISSVAAKVDAPEDSQRDEVLMAVYDEPLPNAVIEKKQLPPSIASIKLGRFAREEHNWVIGKPGRYEGWIARKSGSDGKAKYDGAPWSTAALMRLGNEIIPRSDAVVGTAASRTAVAVTANATPALSRP
jgi:hypothetical protein